MKNLKLKKGFTLTELIIVIVIIGILAAVLIPSLSSYIKKAKKSAAEQDALTAYKEVIADLDANVDDDLLVMEGNFLVQSGNYVVVIEKGAIKNSEEKSLAEYQERFEVKEKADYDKLNETQRAGYSKYYELVVNSDGTKTYDKSAPKYYKVK